MRFLQLTVILLCMLMPSAMAQDETEGTPNVETQAETKAEVADVDSETEVAPPAPGKYQASEQISDDLSVPFPVDI